jgi:hypothetical protein
MKTLSISVLASLLLLGCTTAPPVQHGQEDIWVAISFMRGPENNEIHALISNNLYYDLISGKRKEGWLELNDVHWVEDGKLVSQSKAGSRWHYSNKSIIRIESINRIIPSAESN